MAALFVHHLTVMDFTYVDSARGLVGESWIVDVVLEGALDEHGMVFDFGDVKKQIKRLLDESFDHKLIVPAALATLSVSPDPAAANLDKAGALLTLAWSDAKGRHWKHTSPSQAVVLLPGSEVTKANSTSWLIRQIRPHLPANVSGIRLVLRNEAIEGAFYHYSHGLKSHLGNCQRIAHGHRSQLQILVDGQRTREIEQEWAQRWRDIYIGTQEDLLERFELEGVSYLRFAYSGTQGEFELTLPSDCVYLIETATTVELLARHIARETSTALSGRCVEVHAFEGVWKGAIAYYPS
ncbi:conserved hypothetical protein [gamma proteobacterium HdN1]|nr:conserved hypothetical protein [gamma proteobacterium HdN1]